MAYVDRGSNLKLCMNLLKDERKMVQYEGFHVFKVSSSPVLHPSSLLAGDHLRMETLMSTDLRGQSA